MLERAHDQIADDARHARHALGQFLGRAHGRAFLLEEGGEQLRELPFAVGQRLDFAFGVQFGDADRQAFLPADEPTKLQVVGKNPVGQPVAVAGELLAMRPFAALHFVEVRPNVLGFDVAERNALAGYPKVGAAAKDALRFVGGDDSGAGRLDQLFQRGAVSVFSGISSGKVLS